MTVTHLIQVLELSESRPDNLTTLIEFRGCFLSQCEAVTPGSQRASVDSGNASDPSIWFKFWPVAGCSD